MLCATMHGTVELFENNAGLNVREERENKSQLFVICTVAIKWPETYALNE
jgi:hypothetical protein